MIMRAMSLCLLVCLAGGMLQAADTPTLSTEKEKISYLIGRQMGGSLASQGLGEEVDADLICEGIREALAGKDSAIPQAEAQQILQEFGQRMQKRMMEKRNVQGAENRQEGEEFLAENKQKEGWKETASGLQYKVVEKGEGPHPDTNDVVKVHYRGMLIDGEQFDSSYDRGQPAVFPLGNVIKGWQEALQMMSVGSKWNIVLPADLAYGSRGKGPKIGPDAVLQFEVELLDIQEKADPDPQPAQ